MNEWVASLAIAATVVRSKLTMTTLFDFREMHFAEILVALLVKVMPCARSTGIFQASFNSKMI